MVKKREPAQISVEAIAEQCIAVRLRMLSRAVTRIYNQALRPYGLTTSQMNILVAVSCLGEARQQDICQALHLEKSTLSRDVARMRRQGWLDDVPGEDGRTVLLRITAVGRISLERAIPAWQQALSATVSMMMRFSESPDPVPEGMLQPGFEDKIMHAEFRVGSLTVMASDGCDDQSTFSGFRLALSVPTEADADRVFAALADSGKIEMPLGDRRSGRLDTDRSPTSSTSVGW